MGEALYRKYRPKSFDDVVGQDHVVKTIQNAIKSGRVSHGYLLSGPKGVGKTSIARIIAYTLNNLEYNDTSGSLDIIEIDAASNRRIDEIRELRDKVNIAPTAGKYKVYIIDEVHMLTKEAFNALLKTLEEPPKHAIFILATTEAHKLPETIVSRTQHFTFSLVSKEKAFEHLKKIAKLENIQATDDAIRLVAQYGQGSFRDSISLLDQVSNIKGEINEESIRQLVGAPSSDVAEKLICSGESGDIKALMMQIDAYREKGLNPSKIATQITENVRQQLIDSSVKSVEPALALMKQLIEVPSSFDPDQALEIALIEFTLNNPSLKPVKSEPKKETEKNVSLEVEQKVAKVEKVEPEKPRQIQKPAGPASSNIWSEAIKQLKGKQNTLYGIARMAKADIDGDTLHLTVPYEFHKKRLLESKNQSLISSTLKSLSGKELDIEISVEKKVKPTKVEKTVPDDNAIDVVSKIFGGGEVLET